ncbi:MAG: ABC transporter permease [Burkholderiales bacterium]|nr:ABC transporter permease [Burkholderiales bacterium]
MRLQTPRPSWSACYFATIKQALTNLSCFSFFVFAIVFYSLYYAWPYSSQLPEHITALIADLDQTPVSRAIVLQLRSSPQLDIKGVIQNHADGVSDMKKGEVNALITIPRQFMKDALNGIPTAIELLTNGAFIVESKSAMAGVSGPLQQAAITAIGFHMAEAGVPLGSIAEAAMRAPTIVFQPMYNTVSGYLNYAVPIVFCIIFQTVFLAGTATLLNDWFSEKVYPFALVRGIESTSGYLAIFLAVMSICVFWMLFIEGASFAWHGINSAQNLIGTVIVSIFLAFPIVALSCLIGMLFKQAPYGVQATVITSLPCVFITGYLFPWQNIPYNMQVLASFIPSTPGAQAMVRVSQTGASLSMVFPQLFHLFALGMLYLVLGILVARSYRHDRRVLRSPYAKNFHTPKNLLSL